MDERPQRVSTEMEEMPEDKVLGTVPCLKVRRAVALSQGENPRASGVLEDKGRNCFQQGVGIKTSE